MSDSPESTSRPVTGQIAGGEKKHKDRWGNEQHGKDGTHVIVALTDKAEHHER